MRAATLVPTLWLILGGLGVALTGSACHGDAGSAPAATGDGTPLVTSNQLSLQLTCEQPSNVFLDHETLDVQSGLLFALRIYNQATKKRHLQLNWKLSDATGQVLFRKSGAVGLPRGGMVHRRELVDTPPRGGYLMRVEVTAGTGRPVPLELAFAVVASPAAGADAAPFCAVSTPTMLAERDMEFFERIGARALRSPWMPSSIGGPVGATLQPIADVAGAQEMDVGALDKQLQLRLRHNLATQAVLPLPGTTDQRGPERQHPDEEWLRAGRSLIGHFNDIDRWEIAALGPSDGYGSFAREARALRAGVFVVGPGLTHDEPWVAPEAHDTADAGVDAAAFGWPVEASTAGARPTPGLATGALIWRSLLNKAGQAHATGAGKLFLVQELPDSASRLSAVEQASHLVTSAVLARLAGAAGIALTVQPPNAGASTAQDANSRLAAAARASAFAAMSRHLDGSTAVDELFPQSPIVWGAVYHEAGNAVAVLWSCGDSNRGRLLVRLPHARLVDLFGNEAGDAEHGNLNVPVTPQPVYIMFHGAAETLRQALRRARLEGIRPLAAQALPLTQPPGGKAVPHLRVRLQNIGISSLAGAFNLKPPPGWALIAEHRDFKLGPGESRVLEFGSTRAAPAANGLYPMVMKAHSGASKWQWQQTVRVATATGVRRGHPVRVDGDLSEWRDARWMQIPAGQSSRVWGRMAVRWDRHRLYLAAQIHEPHLRPRPVGDDVYAFWHGNDALQVALGLGGSSLPPGRYPVRDTDYGLLLSPYRVTSSGRVDGRLLRLWSPSCDFATLKDHTRWGGVVPNSQCVVTRDEPHGVTNYEAGMPLDQMPELKPAGRAEHDQDVRFSWIVHNDEGPAVEWSRVGSVFPWWTGGSFAPQAAPYLAAETVVGFNQEGDLDDGAPFPGATRPSRPATNHPHPSRPRSHPGHRLPPRTAEPPELLPMPPSSLPPVAPAAIHIGAPPAR